MQIYIFFCAWISASTSSLCVFGFTLVHTFTIFPSGEIRNVSRCANFISPWAISGTPYAKQTWAEGLDAKGRPRLKPGMDPSIEGTLVFPNIQGASNWPSPSYSPITVPLGLNINPFGMAVFGRS